MGSILKLYPYFKRKCVLILGLTLLLILQTGGDSSKPEGTGEEEGTDGTAKQETTAHAKSLKCDE